MFFFFIIPASQMSILFYYCFFQHNSQSIWIYDKGELYIFLVQIYHAFHCLVPRLSAQLDLQCTYFSKRDFPKLCYCHIRYIYIRYRHIHIQHLFGKKQSKKNQKIWSHLPISKNDFIKIVDKHFHYPFILSHLLKKKGRFIINYCLICIRIVCGSQYGNTPSFLRMKGLSEAVTTVCVSLFAFQSAYLQWLLLRALSWADQLRHSDEGNKRETQRD